MFSGILFLRSNDQLESKWKTAIISIEGYLKQKYSAVEIFLIERTICIAGRSSAEAPGTESVPHRGERCVTCRNFAEKWVSNIRQKSNCRARKHLISNLSQPPWKLAWSCSTPFQHHQHGSGHNSFSDGTRMPAGLTIGRMEYIGEHSPQLTLDPNKRRSATFDTKSKSLAVIRSSTLL